MTSLSVFRVFLGDVFIGYVFLMYLLAILQ